MIKNVFLILAMSFYGVGAWGVPLFKTEQYGPGATPQTPQESSDEQSDVDEPNEIIDGFNQTAASTEAFEAAEAECNAAIEKIEAATQNCMISTSLATTKCEQRKAVMNQKNKENFNNLAKDFSEKLASGGGSIGAAEACENTKKSNQTLSDKLAKTYADYCEKGDSVCSGEKDCVPSKGYDGCARECAEHVRNVVEADVQNRGLKCVSPKSQQRWQEAMSSFEKVAKDDGEHSCKTLAKKVKDKTKELQDSLAANNATNEADTCKGYQVGSTEKSDGEVVATDTPGPSQKASPSSAGPDSSNGNTEQKTADQKKNGSDPLSQVLQGLGALGGLMNQQQGANNSSQVPTAVDPCQGLSAEACCMLKTGGSARDCNQSGQQSPTVTAFSNPLANVGGAKMTSGAADDTVPNIPNSQMQLPEFKNQELPGGQPGAGMYTGGGGGMGGGGGNFKPDPPAGKGRSSLSGIEVLSGTQKGGSGATAALNTRSFSSSSPREPSSSDRAESKPITPDLTKYMPTIQPADVKVSGMENNDVKAGRLGQDFITYCISISQCSTSEANLWGNSRRAVDSLREKYSENFED